METAAAMEIKQGRLRRYSLDDSHSCLKKPPKELGAFFTVTTGSVAVNQSYFLNDLTILPKVTFSNELIGTPPERSLASETPSSAVDRFM